MISRQRNCSIRSVRTRIHSGDLCDHLIQQIYVKDRVLHTKEGQHSAIWARLLDMYGATTDAQALQLLKTAVFNEKAYDEYGIDYEREMRHLYK